MSLVLSDVDDDGIATVTLNRPEKRNALSPELIDALNAAIEDLHQREALRVMILAGAGRSFCAGMDLRGVLDDPAAMGGMLDGLSRAMRRIRRLPVPTIARVQGAAVGGGCGLMVVTDFAITHPEAKVGYPEVGLGVCPAVVAPWLVQKIGAGRARAMLLAGGTVSGAEGHEIGLSTHIVGADELEPTARELATELTGGGGRALSVTKKWLNELDGSMDDEVFDRAAALSAEVIAGSEAQQRLRGIFGA
ncbi:MAG: enoyl-CoA hydratase/isomerase family protein [Planctomycetota bacterium]|jgi:methylglutaconyl-CoA hydratase